MEIKKFSVPELLLRFNKIYQGFADQKSIRYTTRYKSPEVRWLQGDGVAIEQIINRLIESVFTETVKDNIELEVEYLKPNLIFSVTNPGIGIEIESIENQVEKMNGTVSAMTEIISGSFIKVMFKADVLLDIQADTPEDLVLKWQMRDIEMSDLVELVLVSIGEKKSWIDAAIANRDVVELKELVHAAKGLTGNYHMEEFYDLFNKLDEYLVKNSKIDETVHLIVDSISEIIKKIPQKYFDNNENQSLF